MGKSFGDPEHLEFAGVVQGFQVKAGPFAEVRRVAAEVDGDVPNVTAKHTDELALRFSELVVQAAENAS
jgi:predicted lipoprotein